MPHLLQANGIGAAGSCNFVGEQVPSQANVTSRRLTTPLFGLGLIDAVPDSTFEVLAAAQPSAVRGRTNRVLDIATGKLVVGKFARFLHDGRASSVNDAILAHDGQGRAARTVYNLLPQALKSQILAFIQTL